MAHVALKDIEVGHELGEKGMRVAAREVCGPLLKKNARTINRAMRMVRTKFVSGPEDKPPGLLGACNLETALYNYFIKRLDDEKEYQHSATEYAKATAVNHARLMAVLSERGRVFSSNGIKVIAWASYRLLRESGMRTDLRRREWFKLIKRRSGRLWGISIAKAEKRYEEEINRHWHPQPYNTPRHPHF